MTIKDAFATPKRALVTSACAAALVLTVGAGAAFAAESVAESSAIGADNAQNFAFADAGIDPVTAVVDRTEFDFEMGQFVYEVEFVANGVEYEYWVKASNGTILKKAVEIVALDGSSAIATAKITLDRAKEIALADAGVALADATFTEGKLDVEDGLSVYDLAFFAENAEYEYEINAATGAVYSKSRKTVLAPAVSSPPVPAAPAAPVPPGTPATPDGAPSTAYIGVDQAKHIATGRAGLTPASVTFKKAKLEADDGIMVYDIEFFCGGMEYECEINAATGAILEYDCDRDD